MVVQSGQNDISAFLYAVDDAKGLIVVAPGHRDANDIKLYEIRYFADAGYSVVCLDYTGCYTSGGNSMKGYNQSVYDMDALLDDIDMDKRFEGMPIYLFGHSMGAYAVCAELQFGHNIAKVVAASGFDTPKEQWQYSIMDEENHNGHYDYFLTDAALEYEAENPATPIDKELYMEHDADVMNMIIDFLRTDNT